MAATIFLCGMPGSGKTQIGNTVATKFSYHFTDLDTYIEKESGLSPANWIKLKGETVFREKEAAFLRNLPFHEKHLVACGGGTPCFLNNLEWMLSNGELFFLDVSPKILIERLSNPLELNKRPLLQKKGVPLAKVLLDLWDTRKEFYLKIPNWIHDIEELEEFINQNNMMRGNDIN